jgi:Tfp pilus assembly protein PilF
LQADDPAGAVRWLTRTLTVDPRNLSALAALTDAYQQLGSIDAARATLARALALEPTDRTLLALSRRLGKASAEPPLASAP